MSLKPNLYIGIDGGIKGGISGIDDNAKIIFKTEMPTIFSNYDLGLIEEFFLKHKENYNIKVLLEDVHLMPITSDVTKAKMFDLFGIMKGLLFAHKIEYQIIRARIWQKLLFRGIQYAKNTKEAGIKWAIAKYPNEDFRKNNRCRVIHDGITDSICIANYLRYMEIGKL